VLAVQFSFLNALLVPSRPALALAKFSVEFYDRSENLKRQPAGKERD
jgi:hypothetical protein